MPAWRPSSGGRPLCLARPSKPLSKTITHKDLVMAIAIGMQHGHGLNQRLAAIAKDCDPNVLAFLRSVAAGLLETRT